MEKTHVITADFGILGEAVVYLEAKYHPARATSMEAGKPMDDDTGGYWEITDCACDWIPNLDKLRRDFEFVDVALYDALEVEYG